MAAPSSPAPTELDSLTVSSDEGAPELPLARSSLASSASSSLAQGSLAAQQQASPRRATSGSGASSSLAPRWPQAPQGRRSRSARSRSPGAEQALEDIPLPVAQPAVVRPSPALALVYAAQRGGGRDGRSRSMLLSLRWSAGTGGRLRANLANDGTDHYTHALQAVNALSDMSFYIGITEDPVRRWRQHSSRFDSVTVLVEASGSHVTGPLEERLLAFFRGRLMGCLNVGRGGESPTNGTPHYLYVAVRRDGLIRYDSRRRR